MHESDIIEWAAMKLHPPFQSHKMKCRIIMKSHEDQSMVCVHVYICDRIHELQYTHDGNKMLIINYVGTKCDLYGTSHTVELCGVMIHLQMTSNCLTQYYIAHKVT